ncbi:hypothetical protein HY463_01485 [Candidatus Peregrinibacteria bacterium]|nr:hypothetical protein [Candidatus Peregrinibacteria bacterium]
MRNVLPLLPFMSSCSIQDLCGADAVVMQGENFGAMVILDRSDGTFQGYSNPDTSSAMQIYAEEEWRDYAASIIRRYQAVMDNIFIDTPALELQEDYPDDYVCGESDFTDDNSYYICSPAEWTHAEEVDDQTIMAWNATDCSFNYVNGVSAMNPNNLADPVQAYNVLAHASGHLLGLQDTTRSANSNLMDLGALVPRDLSVDLVNREIWQLSHALSCLYKDECLDELSVQEPRTVWDRIVADMSEADSDADQLIY